MAWSRNAGNPRAVPRRARSSLGAGEDVGGDLRHLARVRVDMDREARIGERGRAALDLGQRPARRGGPGEAAAQAPAEGGGRGGEGEVTQVDPAPAKAADQLVEISRID